MIKKIKLVLFALLTLVLVPAYSAGVAGLTYETFKGTGPSPNINPLTYPTVLSTGVSANINYPAGSFGNNLLGSGYIDRVIVKWTGYINFPTSGPAYFGGNADDGLIIRIAYTTVVNSWTDSGGTFRSGSLNLPAGIHPIEVWYYENGGGQMVNLQYWNGTAWAIVPTTMLATDSTYWTPAAPTLCCGGSSSSFSANPVNTAKVTTFVNTVNHGNQVYIEQIGNSNTIAVEQSGSSNNYLDYYGNGSNNNISVTQSGTVNTLTNYIELSVTGNTNTVNLQQTSTGGGKGIFATVADSNNNLIVQQKDNGNHYAEINLSGGNKTVNVLQQGSAAHMANIGLSGNPVSLSLTQSGSAQQFYSINFTCATAGGCTAISVQQGQ